MLKKAVQQGHNERPTTIFPSSRLYVVQDGPDGFPTARVFPILRFYFKGSLVDPRLRASNEHIPIVRVPRAGGRLGYPSHLLLEIHPELEIRPVLIGASTQILLDIRPGEHMAIDRLEGQLAVHKHVRPRDVYFVADVSLVVVRL